LGKLVRTRVYPDCGLINSFLIEQNMFVSREPGLRKPNLKV